MKKFKLRTLNVRKTYGTVVALEAASIKMNEGEFLTLLGPSGSGKTTLLMAIAGINNPDSGEIWIDDKLATYLPPFKRDLGMVFQNYALFPHMTIFDNIAFPLRMRKMDIKLIHKEVARVLEIVELGHVAKRYPRELSGGQQQRIALARCIVYKPSIILMDEPLGALDKKLRGTLQREIKQLHENLGITVLYVTHDQEEAMVMSDRICVMNDGRIDQIGTPDELYFRPSTVFSADFLGESNLFNAEVLEVKKDSVVIRGPAGMTVQGQLNGSVNTGEKVKFMVRPEFVSTGKTVQSDNSAEGILKEVIVTGQITKYFVKLSDSTEMMSLQLTRREVDKVEIGRPIILSWSKINTVVLTNITECSDEH
jgi:putative spermidine/putrescine transport system ATP-binding protein|tara:strand:+ start:103 stop:1203 length:1101 start_codon:yes stop_codon:yes gene_type:complete